MIYFFEMFNIVYLSFLYKVLQDLQQTLEMEIYSQNKNQLKVQNLDEKGKTSSRFLGMKIKQIKTLDSTDGLEDLERKDWKYSPGGPWLTSFQCCTANHVNNVFTKSK